MNSLWERISRGSEKLTADAAKNAPTKKLDTTTSHVWCSAIVVGAEKCPCPKHGGKPKEENKNGTQE